MRAVRFHAFGDLPVTEEISAPACPADGAVVRVRATGVCRSDWHAWQGHDDSVGLPHVPGHEFAGIIEQVGPEVTRFRAGQRVTAPFILACGRCAQCREGAPQVCPNQRQPGFDLQGSWAELVAVPSADTNLVELPDDLDLAVAAGLGCRVGTAFHAVHVQARVQEGERVAVLGCGGVGLAVAMIARAAGAEVYAVDVSEAALAAATELGATAVPAGEDVAARLRDLTGGGVEVAVDALGSTATARAGIESLRPRGRHVQVGLLLGDDTDPALPMGRVIAQELVILGSHGLGAAEYPALLADVASGRLDLARTIGSVIAFEELPAALEGMGHARATAGMTVATIP
ncbi:alcohol dehydrogenase catalytic domain-containing protein [Brachybacterium sp. AOP25-B2-12]|uniref:alcohol dehydrogenase catalytic domain-containing protein n=1 Tax=Brachybacterium sp. AOP25-B2-12 TaxID=3457710 RepID=UPI0040338C14